MFGRHADGTGRYSWYLVHELRNLGLEVDVFSSTLHVRRVGPLFHFLASAHEANLNREFRHYDVVHSNEGAGLLVFHPCMIETYHHDYAQTNEFGDCVFNLLENVECHKVRHIVVPSCASKNSLLDYGFSPSKISVIHHGVNHELFKKDEVLRESMRRKLGLCNYFVVLNVGRLVKHKGHAALVRIMQKLPKSALIVVGKGKEELPVREIASKMGVKMLHFKDVTDEFLSGLYNAADLYVHTSTLEGFGLTVLEAMACGLPVIAYKVADFEQVVGGAGHLVDIGDVEGIKSKLWLLFQDEDMRRRLGELAYLRSKDFSWSETARKHVHVYKSAF